MGRLFVVSNRVAQPGDVQTGGLATALQTVLREQRGVWVGWSGSYGEGPPHVHIGEGIRYCTLDIPEPDFNAYYHHFANRTLWPLFHYRVDLVDYRREAYEGYRDVNRRFARALARELCADDVVWVHDYHLIPLAQEMRKLGFAQRIGFFLHIPMPSWDVLSMLPGHEELLGCLADYDLVGLQTDGDRENLRASLETIGRNGIRCELATFPIGIDANAVAQVAAAPVALSAAEELRASLSGKRLAVGVDRLDYSKGLPERFRAFARYLERKRAHREPLTYLQIAPATRTAVPEYQKLRKELEGLAGHINGTHARPDWTPIRYVNHSYPHSVLTGFYRAADLALVTPLRDGMNLVAKEYVASQDPSDPGVLVLSRMAGAADSLPEALLVNPHDMDEVASAIDTAVSMPAPERRRRWQAMMENLRRNDIKRWASDFLERLRGPATAPSARLDAAAPPKTALMLATRRT
ncbi:alpha,alpha-trehalose-phosphate synthase (UDP-forming) [Pseudoxanthomonas sacheonensis]|uniref:alpha,alpha-trehalose-phosphate synthase (UDP-forming) n=1 Tax=Pseudoxanthomonas sacheonensis TaxID=443615 RepID=UPI0013D148BC|nr:trehalose-6-phosphate synthase [Pseudoxanthomonas sacheonensis]